MALVEGDSIKYILEQFAAVVGVFNSRRLAHLRVASSPLIFLFSNSNFLMNATMRDVIACYFAGW